MAGQIAVRGRLLVVTVVGACIGNPGGESTRARLPLVCGEFKVSARAPALQRKNIISWLSCPFTVQEYHLSTATTTSTDTGQHTPTRGRQREALQPVTQQERSAAQRLRTTMAAVKLAFTWLGVRKTLAPEQRTTAARAFHADRELLSAGRHQLDRG